ncbi:DUF5317 family protein [Crassaminicella profunda]|uniref:DUF5317 family protein n=1 Tax=Crassaminicella profunda TaxID=1286698 RepID=UPI001CA62184|nr:DUF5317 family protein [Crassaminicella profunda]QZY54282.1 DUF5317 domain-containing protein [Crassaminicella profunda]
MVIAGTIMGFVLGKIRGGKVQNLRFLHIRLWPLVIISLMIQAVLSFSNQIPLLTEYGTYFYGFSLVLLAVTLVLNIDKKGFWAMLIGVILNLIIIFINSAKLPGFLSGLNFHIVISKTYPLSNELSIGDLLVSLGMILFMQGEMLRSRFGQRPTTMIEFQYKGKQ